MPVRRKSRGSHRSSGTQTSTPSSLTRLRSRRTGPASDVFPSSDVHNCRLVQSPVAETGCSTDHSESATIMLPSSSQSAAVEEACYDFAQYMAGEEDADPYLSYRPTFGYSMPAQVFIQGITFTLLAVLLIHILFTTPYHWPLSRLNYILQVSGILLVTASVLLSTGLTLTAPDVTAKTWPYMLQYISVTIPPEDWSIGAQAAYQLLQGFCNMAVNVSWIGNIGSLEYGKLTTIRLAARSHSILDSVIPIFD